MRPRIRRPRNAAAKTAGVAATATSTVAGRLKPAFRTLGNGGGVGVLKRKTKSNDGTHSHRATDMQDETQAQLRRCQKQPRSAHSYSLGSIACSGARSLR